MATRVALVTGSSAGIGLGIARRLVEKCHVILTGLADDNTRHGLFKELSSIPKRKDYHFVDSNLASEEGVTSLCAEVTKLYPNGLDILVNNAGIQHVSPLVDFPMTTWHKMLAIHLTSSFVLIQRFMPGMMDRVVNKQVRNYAAERQMSFEEAWVEYYKHTHPTGKPITTEQVASLVEYLCSDDAASITGTAIPIDGGYTAR